MFHTLNSVLAPAVMERLTLVINHVLASENVATERLKPHAGRSVELATSGWPSLLPKPPACVFRVTPAGLLEWAGLEPATTADLAVRVDASNPALLLSKALGGTLPPVAVEGDAQLAGDVNWLLQNLRWDVASDLERLFGPTVAQPLLSVGAMLASALRTALQAAAGLGERLRSGRA